MPSAAIASSRDISDKKDVSVKKSGTYTRFAVAVYFMIFARDIFGGLIRYYTDRMGVAPLWFLPDAAAALFVVISFTRRISRGDRASLYFVTSIVFAASLGFLTSESMLSVTSALKMVLPLYFGIFAGDSFNAIFEKRFIHLVIIIVSIVAIVASVNTVFPWTNYATSELGVNHVTSVQRNMDGLDRAAGFATINAVAAFTLMMAALVLMMRTGFIGRILIFFPSAYGIYLTTSRSTLGAFALAYLILAVQSKGSTRLPRAFFLWSCFLCALAPVVLPLALNDVAYNDLPKALGSIVMRAQDSWTKPLEFVVNQFPFSLVIGLGLGLVGYPVLFSPYADAYGTGTDNFMLSSYLMFGIPGLIGIAILMRRAARTLDGNGLIIGATLLLWATTLEGYGTSLFCVIIGMVLSPFSTKAIKTPS